MEAKDTENGVYQWVYEMATSIEDVTKDHTDDLTKYGVTLPEGTAAADVKEGYVFEIKLNKDAKWENGEPINADTYVYSMKMLLDPKYKNYRATDYFDGSLCIANAKNDYIYSMQQLLNPDMKNYRANLYIAGESALAGASEYYYSKDDGFYKAAATLGYADLAAAMAATTVYIDIWDFWGAEGYVDANGNEQMIYSEIPTEYVEGVNCYENLAKNAASY